MQAAIPGARGGLSTTSATPAPRLATLAGSCNGGKRGSSATCAALEAGGLQGRAAWMWLQGGLRAATAGYRWSGLFAD